MLNYIEIKMKRNSQSNDRNLGYLSTYNLKIHHAVKLAMEKDSHSPFYWKLHQLTDRINDYVSLFYGNPSNSNKKVSGLAKSTQPFAQSNSLHRPSLMSWQSAENNVYLSWWRKQTRRRVNGTSTKELTGEAPISTGKELTQMRILRVQGTSCCLKLHVIRSGKKICRRPTIEDVSY